MAKRKIEPHKGGRDKHLNARVTRVEKDRIGRILDRRGLSLSDWIMLMVEIEEKLFDVESHNP